MRKRNDAIATWSPYLSWIDADASLGKVESHEFRHDWPPGPRHGGDGAAGKPHRRAADRPGATRSGPWSGRRAGRGSSRGWASRSSAEISPIRRPASGRSTTSPWSSTARRRSATGDAGRSSRSAASTPRGRWPRRRHGPGIDRFVHISSTSAYGHPPDQPTPIDETAALGQNVWVLDHYTRSKVECERLLWDMAASGTAAADGDPAELALRRARSDHDSPADPGIPLAPGVDRRARATIR